METILTFLVMFIISVILYTAAVKNNATNKHVPHFDYWSTIKDGMKGMAIGFGIVIALYYLAGFILTTIHTS